MKKHKSSTGKPEFKRHFFVNWNAQDWLGDQNLKLCPPEVKGFWMDLLMHMVRAFPYGHLSRLSKPLMRESKLPLVKKILPIHQPKSLLYQNPHQIGNTLVYQEHGQQDDQEDDQWVRMSVGLSLPEQLSLCVSLEEKITDLTGYNAEKVTEWVSILDDYNVFSRTQNGIIYNRRMVKDFHKRKIAFINANKGVNPYEWKPASRRRSSDLPYQNHDQSTDQDANQGTRQSSDQTGNQPAGDLVEDQHHQFASISNSISNSNSSLDIKSTNINTGNGISLGESEEEKNKKNNVGGQSGAVNGKQKIDFTGLKTFKETLLADKNFMEPFQMAIAKDITLEKIDGWLNVFNLHCVVQQKTEKDYHDYMSHFRSWFFKGDRTQNPPSMTEIQKVAKNKEQSKSLLAKYDTIV